MKYIVKVWDGMGPTLNSEAVEIEASTPAEAEKIAKEQTGKKKARAKVPFATQI